MRHIKQDVDWLETAIQSLRKKVEDGALISWSITWHTDTTNSTVEWRQEDNDEKKLGFG